jgi:predicted acetyltransferase
MTSGSLDYRFARPDEIPALARLVTHSFPGAARPASWWEEQLRTPVYGGGPDTVLVAEEALGAGAGEGHGGAAAGDVVGLCQIHPLRQWIGGEALPVAGIGTVTVSPAHRRRGAAGALVTAALRAARSRGDVASALYPFREQFYRGLGYGRAGAVLQYQVPAAALPDAPERLRVELLESAPAQAEALALYGRWARAETGQLERGDALWRVLCTLPDRVLAGYRAPGGVLEGYALAVYRTDLPPPQRFLEVEELVWTTTAARRGLYAWLASLADQWPALLLRALPWHGLGDWLAEARLPYWSAPGWGLWAPAATLLHGPMFRIVDVPGAWSRRRVAAETTSLAVRVELTDAQLPENGGAWRLVLEGDSVEVERDGKADCTLRCDVATLSRLYIGSLTAAAARAAGLLELDGADRLRELDAALRLPEAWTYDRF